MCNKSLFVGMEFTLVQLSDGDIRKRKQKICGHTSQVHYGNSFVVVIIILGDTVYMAFTSNFT